jgi:hypothetical protein
MEQGWKDLCSDDFEQIVKELDHPTTWNLIPIFQPALNSFDLLRTLENTSPIPSVLSSSGGMSPRTGGDCCGSSSHDSEESWWTSAFKKQETTTSGVKERIRKKRYRKRSACIEDLEDCGIYDNPEDPENDKYKPYIRKWKNDRNMTFYDCVCGRRRAVQDLKKLKRHVNTIHEVDP